MNSTSFPALGNTHSFSCGETARSRVAKVDLQLLPSSCGTERDRFPQQSPEQTGLEREKGTGPGWAGMRGKGPGCGERGGRMEKGRPERGAQGGSRGAPRATDPPSRSPEGRWVGRSGALPSTAPQRPPGSPRSAGPPQRAPPPHSAGTHRPQRGALPPHGLRDLSLAFSAATPLPHPPPPDSPPPFSASCSLSTSMIRPGESPAAPRGSPRPSPAQTGPRSQQDPALSDAPTWRPRRARARPRGPARRGRSHRAGPMGGPAAGAGSMGPA